MTRFRALQVSETYYNVSFLRKHQQLLLFIWTEKIERLLDTLNFSLEF